MTDRIWYCAHCRAEVKSSTLPLGWYTLQRRIRATGGHADGAMGFSRWEGAYCCVSCLLGDGDRLTRREREANAACGIFSPHKRVPTPRDVAKRIERGGTHRGPREEVETNA